LFSYNSEGLLVERSLTQELHFFRKRVFQYEYDSKKRLVRVNSLYSRNVEDSLRLGKITKFEYDNKDFVDREAVLEIGENGIINNSTSFKYEFDFSGNLTKKKRYHLGELAFIVEFQNYDDKPNPYFALNIEPENITLQSSPNNSRTRINKNSDRSIGSITEYGFEYSEDGFLENILHESGDISLTFIYD